MSILFPATQKPPVDPIRQLLDALRGAGRAGFVAEQPWESCLCALVYALNPRLRAEQILEALPRRDGILDEGIALNVFAHLGYLARPVHSCLQDIDARLLPCLFVSADGEPTVLLKHDAEQLTLYRGGKITTTPKSRINQDGTAWILERFDDSRLPISKFMRAGTNQSWFRALLGRFHATFAQILLTGLALNLLALATPLYTMLVYDRVIAAGSKGPLPMLAAGVGLAIIFESILRRIRARGLSWLAARLDNIVGNRIFAHLVGLPPSLIERASVAAQIARIKTFESVRDFFSGPMFLSMLEIPFVAVAALAIWALAGPLVFVPLAVIGFYGVLFLAIRHRVKTAIRLAAKASSARQQFTIETFQKVKGVRAYGLGKIWQAKFRDLSGREMLAHFHLNWLGLVAETCAHALTIAAAAATIGFGVQMVWSGAMSTGALVATMILVWRVLTPFYGLCTMIPRLEQLRNSILQVNKLMDLDTEAMTAHGSARLPVLHGRVGFAHTTLRYGDEADPVFAELSFEAKAGELVVITGDSGAGKTSLLKLVKGLYTPVSGSVQIDGFDIRQLDAPDLRRQISYVPQAPDFFHGTILDNLRLGNALADAAAVEAALLLADAWQEVLALPHGLNTMIGRQGELALPLALATKLSLARAYLHPAPLLLIDELPNVLLSGRTGKNLRDYLVGIHGRRTVLIVTYRDDFMALADSVVVLRRDATPWVGPRAHLLAPPPEAQITPQKEEAA